MPLARGPPRRHTRPSVRGECTWLAAMAWLVACRADAVTPPLPPAATPRAPVEDPAATHAFN